MTCNIIPKHTKHKKKSTIYYLIQLSNEDLSLCKTSEGITCFASVQKIPNKLYLANVQEPIEYLKSLDSDQPEIVVNADGGVIPTIVPEKGKFVFITFNDAPSAAADSTPESRAALLQSHDKIISELTKQIAELHDNILIIYTGEHSNLNARQKRETEEKNNSSPTNKTAPEPAAAIAATASETPVPAATTLKEVVEPKAVQKFISPLTTKVDDDSPFYNLEHLLIYYRNITIVNEKNEETLFDNHRPVLTKHEEYWTIDMTDGTNKFAFNMTNASGRWWIDGAKWKNDAVSSKIIIAANEGFGFHCSPTIEFKQGKNIVLRWRHLQIQPNFGTEKMTVFGDSFDCVGFTSPGIWAGLFITFIMIFILTIGMCWMLDIRTMDRFDDPKGKTITVNVNE